MPTYELDIAVDDTGLTQIAAAGQQVTIVKQVPGGELVAWILFTPLESNSITWTETYSVYASATNIEDGATIVTESTAPAAGGSTYSFESGQFAAEVPGISDSDYAVVDNDADIVINGVEMITSGLYQGAVVNGNSSSSPLNAVPVLYNETATFTPIETIQIFLSSYDNNGMVISEVASDALTVTYTTDLVQQIYFDDATNTFQMGSLPASDELKKRRRAHARVRSRAQAQARVRSRAQLGAE